MKIDIYIYVDIWISIVSNGRTETSKEPKLHLQRRDLRGFNLSGDSQTLRKIF